MQAHIINCCPHQMQYMGPRVLVCVSDYKLAKWFTQFFLGGSFKSNQTLFFLPKHHINLVCGEGSRHVYPFGHTFLGRRCCHCEGKPEIGHGPQRPRIAPWQIVFLLFLGLLAICVPHLRLCFFQRRRTVVHPLLSPSRCPDTYSSRNPSVLFLDPSSCSRLSIPLKDRLSDESIREGIHTTLPTHGWPFACCMFGGWRLLDPLGWIV